MLLWDPHLKKPSVSHPSIMYATANRAVFNLFCCFLAASAGILNNHVGSWVFSLESEWNLKKISILLVSFYIYINSEFQWALYKIAGKNLLQSATFYSEYISEVLLFHFYLRKKVKSWLQLLLRYLFKGISPLFDRVLNQCTDTLSRVSVFVPNWHPCVVLPPLSKDAPEALKRRGSVPK